MNNDKWLIISKWLERWIRLGQKGITLEQLLVERNLYHIAIYGYTEIARCMIYELKNSKINVETIIDKRGGDVPIDFPCIIPNQVEGLKVDAIINTVGWDECIVDISLQDGGIKVLSFGDIIYEL